MTESVLVMCCLAAAACGDRDAPSPPPQSAPAQTPTVDALVQTPSDAPAVAVRPPPLVASWSSLPGDQTRPAWPTCITNHTRFIQYADRDANGSPRFCVWSSPDLSKARIGCWRVDLVTGTYVPETGVWFSAPVPQRDDRRGPVRLGDVTVHPDGHVVVAGDPPRTLRPPRCGAR